MSDAAEVIVATYGLNRADLIAIREQIRRDVGAEIEQGRILARAQVELEIERDTKLVARLRSEIATLNRKCLDWRKRAEDYRRENHELRLLIALRGRDPRWDVQPEDQDLWDCGRIDSLPEDRP